MYWLDPTAWLIIGVMRLADPPDAARHLLIQLAQT